MRRSAFLLTAALAACSSDRVETLSRAPSFRAETLTLAGVRGAKGKNSELFRFIAARLEAAGMRFIDLESADSVLAGTSLSLETAASPRLLSEIRRATGADGVVFLSVDPSGRSLDVTVLDIRTGDSVLRSAARPSGESFSGIPEVAEAAVQSLLSLSPDRHKAVRAADPVDEIPVP